MANCNLYDLRITTIKFKSKSKTLQITVIVSFSYNILYTKLESYKLEYTHEL